MFALNHFVNAAQYRYSKLGTRLVFIFSIKKEAFFFFISSSAFHFTNKFSVNRNIYSRRSRWNQSVGRSVCEWQALARLSQTAHSRVGKARRATVRYISTVASVSRVCEQNIGQILRDGLHQAGSDRRLQAQGGHAHSRRSDR